MTSYAVTMNEGIVAILSVASSYMLMTGVNVNAQSSGKWSSDVTSLTCRFTYTLFTTSFVQISNMSLSITQGSITSPRLIHVTSFYNDPPNILTWKPCAVLVFSNQSDVFRFVMKRHLTSFKRRVLSHGYIAPEVSNNQSGCNNDVFFLFGKICVLTDVF